MGPFFWASLDSILLPPAIGSLVCGLALITTQVSREISCKDKDDFIFGCCCGPFILAVLILIFGGCFLLLGIVWVLSPVLHLIQACFLLFGVKPVGGREAEIQGEGFNQFWLFVMILKACEQFLEALPQTVTTLIYLDKFWDNLTDWEIRKLVASIVFSVGSLLLFIVGNVYKCVFDYHNSIVGLYKS